MNDLANEILTTDNLEALILREWCKEAAHRFDAECKAEVDRIISGDPSKNMPLGVLSFKVEA